MTSGRQSPGAPSNTRIKVMTATVASTSRPVMISFRRNCIFASFQDGTFSAAAQKLLHDRIVRFLEPVGFGVFDNFALIEHGHASADAKGAVHLMSDNNRCHL